MEDVIKRLYVSRGERRLLHGEEEEFLRWKEEGGKGEPRIKKAWNQQGSEKRWCRGQRIRPE